ncbi:myrosinase 1-like [Chrysoperla carnea]|uniref:myrosinase 1-like n=1 Tax=Chrysoperla carnea TaxID=189513 RepID=UPI001D09469A|nr:myrosinase 1-like [Chrysoperla carnea]
MDLVIIDRMQNQWDTWLSSRKYYFGYANTQLPLESELQEDNQVVIISSPDFNIHMKEQSFTRSRTAAAVIDTNVSGTLVSRSVNFPKDFIFGVTTSASQIEGAWNESGKGESNVDYRTHFCPESIKDHSTVDIACDSYHKVNEDLKIIRELGVQSYRFSLSWARILPDGFSNHINNDAIRYYNELINGLIRYNITPLVTIFHFDYPECLHEIGDWTNTNIIEFYVDYARVVFETFGDRVKHWITFNEPHILCTYIKVKKSTVIFEGLEPYLCAYTILIAHAKTYNMYKNDFFVNQKGKIGVAYDMGWLEPKTNSKEDIEAAKRGYEFQVGLYANAIYSKDGDFPAIVKERVAYMSARQNLSKSRLPKLTSEEIKYIRGTADFLAINHYKTSLTSEPTNDSSTEISYVVDTHVTEENDPSWPTGENGWPNVPWGMYKLLVYIRDAYGNPTVYITENGFTENSLQDNGRINFLQGYIESVSNAIAVGCNVVGYYVWSLMDNFEFSSGYTVHFGLYQTNFTDPNRTRTPRASAIWYRNCIKN